MYAWIVLPYDESSVARAAVVRVVPLARKSPITSAGIMLAIAGVDPAVGEYVVERARRLVGADIRLGGRLIAAAHPAAALDRLLTQLPNATLAVPLPLFTATNWYSTAVR